MRVRFTSILNGNRDIKHDLGTEIMNQILLDEGYNSKCINLYYTNKVQYSTSVEYSEYVCELGDLPLLVKMVENYRNGIELDEGIGVDGGTYEYISYPEVFKDIDNHIENMSITRNDIFCFSTTYISIIPMIYYALKLRQLDEDIRIVFGGYHVTFSKHIRDIILKLGIADTVVINDGASVIIDIVNGRKGLINGSFIKNCRLPNYDEKKIEDSNKWATTITSLGCPNSCSFCASDRKYLGFDMDYIRDYHISLLEKYPDIKFYFTDDNINISIDRFDKVADLIVELNRPWRAFANPIYINSKITEKLSSIPCDFIYLGAEGFSNEILKHLGKPKLSKQIIKAGIELMAKNKLNLYLGLIIGMPGETEKTFNETNAICRELTSKYGKRSEGGLIDIIPTPFKIFPNSDNYKNPKKYNIKYEYWEDKYTSRIPEISNILSKIPKKFIVDGMDYGWSRKKVMSLREEYGLPLK